MKIKRFQFGEWQVNAQSCAIRHAGEAADIQLEPRAMDVLCALCQIPGRILSAEDLLHLCWDGIAVGENQVHKAIAQLRRVLGDSATDPRYIENIRKRGYRTVAPVTLAPEHVLDQAVERWSLQSPYVGLDPFDAAHSAVFFGRDMAIDRLRQALVAQVAVGRAFVLVLGPSGSGKTSLVQAGLLPALLRETSPFRVAATTTLDLGDIGAVPLPTALGGALLDLDQGGEPLFAGQSAEGIGASLVGDPGFPRDGLRTTAPDERYILFIDRLEALFNPAAAGTLQRGLFLNALDRLARIGPIIIIAACRNDFYPDLAKEPVLMEGKGSGGHFDLAPPTRAEIAQMIRLPATVAGLSFGAAPDSDDHLDDLLCDGVANSPDALPLLQYTLQQLYLQRSPGRELTIAAYRALGGIDGAIGRRAESILNSLGDGSQAALPRIFSLIVAAGSSDGAARSLRAPWSALVTEAERLLVRTLVDQRLFVSLVYGKEAVFGVAHEALLRQWPRAVSWITEHRHALRTRNQLEALAQQWVAEGRAADRLLRRGKPLEEARDILKAAIVPLSADATAMIDASTRQAKRFDRLRLGALASFAVIALVAVFLGLRAGQAERVAAQRLREAEDLVDYMLGDLAEKLKPLGKLDLLDGVAQKALGYLTVEDIGRVPGPARLRQAKALLTLADVNRARGDTATAKKALVQADALLAADLAEGSVDHELLKNAGAVAFWFGQMASDQGALDEAERHFIRYRDIAQRMVTLGPNNPDAWKELSFALSGVGSLKLRKGDTEAAATSFEGSIALKRRAMERHPADRSLTADLANSLSWLANVEAQRGRLDPALRLYDEQRQVLEGLRRDEPDVAVWTYRIALANRLKGVLLAALGHPKDALTTLDDAAAQIEDSLRKEPGNQLWQVSRIDIMLQRSRIALALGSAAVVGGDLDRIFGLVERGLTINPADDNLLRHQAQALLLRAAALLREGRLAPADAEAGRAEQIIRPAGSPGPKDKLKAILLSNILLLRADVSRRRGAVDAAERKCRDAADNLRPLASSSSDFRILAPWVRAVHCGGDRDTAVAGIASLERMGYRDIDYVQFLKTQKE